MSLCKKQAEKVPAIKHEQVSWLIYATVSNLVATYGYYGAASYIKLSGIGTVFTLFITVMSLVLELLLRSHKTGKMQVVATILAELGCVLNIQPWRIFDSEPAKYAALTNNTVNLTTMPSTRLSIIMAGFNGTENLMYRANVNPISTEELRMGLPILLLASIGCVVYFHIVGAHLAEMEAGLLFSIVSSFGAVGSLLCSLYLEPFDLRVLLIPRQLLLTVAHCILSGLGLLCLTATLQIIGSMRTILTMSLDGIVSLILQYTLMKNYKPGYRNMLEGTGVVFTFMAIILSPIFDYIRKRYASHVDFDH